MNWYKKAQRLNSMRGYWLCPDGSFKELRGPESHLKAIPRIAKEYGIYGFSPKRIEQNEDSVFEEFLKHGFVRFFNGFSTLVISKSSNPLNKKQIDSIMGLARPNLKYYITNSFSGSPVELSDMEDLKEVLSGNPVSSIYVDRARTASLKKRAQEDKDDTIQESIVEWISEEALKSQEAMIEKVWSKIQEFSPFISYRRADVVSLIQQKINGTESEKELKQLEDVFVLSAFLHWHTQNGLYQSFNIVAGNPEIIETLLLLFRQNKLSRNNAPQVLGHIFDLLSAGKLTGNAKIDSRSIINWLNRPAQKGMKTTAQVNDDILQEVMEDYSGKNILDRFNATINVDAIEKICDMYGFNILRTRTSMNPEGNTITLSIIKNNQFIAGNKELLMNHLSSLKGMEATEKQPGVIEIKITPERVQGYGGKPFLSRREWKTAEVDDDILREVMLETHKDFLEQQALEEKKKQKDLVKKQNLFKNHKMDYLLLREIAQMFGLNPPGITSVPLTPGRPTFFTIPGAKAAQTLDILEMCKFLTSLPDVEKADVGTIHDGDIYVDVVEKDPVKDISHEEWKDINEQSGVDYNNNIDT